MNFDEKSSIASTASPENHTHRRTFLRRNIAAIGAILTASMSGSASAHPGPELHDPEGVGRGRGGGRGGRGGGGRGPKCFLKGASIRTVDGERKVEDLREGDLLPTLFGGVQSIERIGRFSYRRSDMTRPWNSGLRPIRIARSAIASGVPANDLYVSAGHCLYLDGMLVPAGSLVNGTTIIAEAADALDELEYFHIKLASHDVIYAEGVACETLLAAEARAGAVDEEARLADFASTVAACAPLAQYGGRRGLVASRLRSAISPWFDIRSRIDVLRDGLEDRAAALV